MKKFLDYLKALVARFSKKPVKPVEVVPFEHVDPAPVVIEIKPAAPVAPPVVPTPVQPAFVISEAVATPNSVVSRMSGVTGQICTYTVVVPDGYDGGVRMQWAKDTGNDADLCYVWASQEPAGRAVNPSGKVEMMVTAAQVALDVPKHLQPGKNCYLNLQAKNGTKMVVVCQVHFDKGHMYATRPIG